MGEDAKLRLASSFGGVAAAYAEHRPSYARAAMRWALKGAPGLRVLDLGAGTGKLTAVLAGLGVDVVAVEPDPAMLAELRRALPQVATIIGDAEAIPLLDASVDAVLAGNAMHWFDMDVAGPQIARVLAPGGTLAGLWNLFDDRVEWVAELARISGEAAVGLRDTRTAWRSASAMQRFPDLDSLRSFGAVEKSEFEHGQRRTAESLVATFATKAGMLVMPAYQRDVTLRRIRAFLASRPETSSGEFTLPMVTGVLRARRR